MKVDTEGAEVELFRTTDDDLLQRVDPITIEFHDDHGLITHQDFRVIYERLAKLCF